MFILSKQPGGRSLSQAYSQSDRERLQPAAFLDQPVCQRRLPMIDMGDDSDPFRDVLRSQNNTPVIPGRKNRKIKIEYDKVVYKLRKRIEQFFGKLKENKRLAMRYEKSDDVFLAFIALGIIMTLI